MNLQKYLEIKNWLGQMGNFCDFSTFLTILHKCPPNTRLYSENDNFQPTLMLTRTIR